MANFVPFPVYGSVIQILSLWHSVFIIFTRISLLIWGVDSLPLASGVFLFPGFSYLSACHSGYTNSLRILFPFHFIHMHWFHEDAHTQNTDTPPFAVVHPSLPFIALTVIQKHRNIENLYHEGKASERQQLMMESSPLKFFANWESTESRHELQSNKYLPKGEEWSMKHQVRRQAQRVNHNIQ